jgi:hypothetical protein
MTERDERKWRQLCNQAMIENDPNKLLSIFLELDLAMEEEQRGSAPVDLRGNRRIEGSARLI